MSNKEYVVMFSGFKTQEQAEKFICWYSLFGEQFSGDWLGEHGFAAYDSNEPNVNYDIISQRYINVTECKLRIDEN
jgi:hypothetical protein